jgi:hypothetical protein
VMEVRARIQSYLAVAAGIILKSSCNSSLGGSEKEIDG